MIPLKLMTWLASPFPFVCANGRLSSGPVTDGRVGARKDGGGVCPSLRFFESMDSIEKKMSGCTHFISHSSIVGRRSLNLDGNHHLGSAARTLPLQPSGSTAKPSQPYHSDLAIERDCVSTRLPLIQSFVDLTVNPNPNPTT